MRRWQAYCCRSKMQPDRASALRKTSQERERRPMISQGTPGAAKLTIILLGSISSSPKLYPNQSRTRVARPMVSQGTQRLAAMGNSQTVLACHCIARLFFRDLFPDPRCAKNGPGECYFSCRVPVGSTLSARSQLDRCGPSLQFLQRNTAAGSQAPVFV